MKVTRRVRRTAVSSLVAALALVATLLTGCSGDEGDAAPAPSTATSGTPSADPEPSRAESEEAEPSADPADDLPPVHSATSLPALMRERLTGGRITRVRQQAVTDAYTRWEVTYPSGDLTVSGVLLVPNGEGPFPGIVLNHGYIDPSIYGTVTYMARYTDPLAAAGFLVVHPDYRGYGNSQPGPNPFRIGFAVDVLHLIQAVKSLPMAQAEAIGLFGHSMGGGISLRVATVTDEVEAVLLYGSMSGDEQANLSKIVEWSGRADLPELGQLDHKQIAKLVGVAPLNRDSGKFRGRRAIFGGRSTVRAALYMAAFNAMRCNPQIRAFYLRLRQAGKCYRVAITACMRKLLTVLNALVRDNVPWRKINMAT